VQGGGGGKRDIEGEREGGREGGGEREREREIDRQRERDRERASERARKKDLEALQVGPVLIIDLLLLSCLGSLILNLHEPLREVGEESQVSTRRHVGMLVKVSKSKESHASIPSRVRLSK
jgi:hypothetical protein